ncbi:MAG TPA: hypothetical protein VFX92_07795, partial [Candidatus Krumholzibacteria bacterium]|nr:hypothetical protein [Candidatus Krumholzibacteria bacterium]
GTAAPIVTFATRAHMDPRDALRGAGVMTVGDSSVAAYASSLGMKTAALPFDRTYLLLSPARVRSILSSAHPDALAAVTQRDLAFSVRAAVTRATASAAWWVTDLNGCGPLPAWPSWRLPAAPARTGAPSVYYDERDATARDLAERIVALAAMDTTRSAAAAGLARSVPMPVGGMAVIAKGVDISELSSRMQHGDGFIFITSIPSPVPDPCGAARALLRAAPWLVAGDAPVAQSVVPLVDARRFVVVGHPALAVEWDVFGTIRIVPAGAGAR